MIAARLLFKKIEISVAISDRATAISFSLVSGDGRSWKIFFGGYYAMYVTYSKLSMFYKYLEFHILRSKALFTINRMETFN